MVHYGAQERYRNDAQVLAALGTHLASSKLPSLEVRLPKALADAAVAAWLRDENDNVSPEGSAERVHRIRAGSLALIGLSIVNSSRLDGDEVIVELQPGLIGDAMSAADELG